MEEGNTSSYIYFILVEEELEKSDTLKQKLEQLCRDLHRESKSYKEESRKQLESEKQKRLDLSKKFETTIAEVTARLKEDMEKKASQAINNEKLQEKVKNVLYQYDIREKHFEAVLRAKEIEVKLAYAKFNRQQVITDRNAALTQQLKELEDKTKLENETKDAKILSLSESVKSLETRLNKTNEICSKFQHELDQAQKMLTKQNMDNQQMKAYNDKVTKEYILATERIEALENELSTKQKLDLESFFADLGL